ncbi:glycosyltransferase family 2 protein [Candidatus Nitrosotenuis sp. DW1]|uniref:glycosyltransferase family 2 protein n=1 Tax=Candidatus Nitrosotenuis sp. DW1 TaxID=2259672 RepID=UPI0015CC4379|nr:glycosyltransferase family 2 protein [Candidatus Nitrosotenuis sp. DW1]
MDSNVTLLEIVKKLQDAEMGDSGRLSYILHSLEKGKKIYESDKKYLNKKHEQLQKTQSVKNTEKQNLKPLNSPAVPHSNRVLINRMHKCASCGNDLGLEERTTRYENRWFHTACFSSVLKESTLPKSTQVVEVPPHVEPCHAEALQTKPIEQIRTKALRTKADPVLVLLASMIFSLLVITAYSMLSYLSLIAISVAAVMVFYHIVSRKEPKSQYSYGRRAASSYSIMVMIMPFVLGTLIAYDGHASGIAGVIQTIFVWCLMLSFWQTMLFVPLAIRSIALEALLREPDPYPKISVLVPAYNEEKVIRTTIESLLATDYPDKEIIVIDDGSKDKTLEIASYYKDKIKVIHKENGGKASALNAGMLYATGSIITILDADTIIGHTALKHIAKSFSTENVAAVAGNIKIRNRVNCLTWCQALEYLSGIQIMRRGLDYFGAITIVPGALGAFKKKKLEEAGAYHKDTLVEDFDATVKVLRSGMVVNGSNMATAYTQAPQKLHDFYKQRKRWYRGNLQVLRRHSDILTNPRFGYLHKFSYPLLVIHMLVIPTTSLMVLGFTVYQLLLGNYSYVAFVLGMFIVLQYLLSAMAVRMDRDDKKMILYSVFLVIGYKQLIDILQLKALFEELVGLKAKWTSAQRIQQ